MCEACGVISFADLLQDPLIQLVMRSDGVTAQDMIELREMVRRAHAHAIPPCASEAPPR